MGVRKRLAAELRKEKNSVISGLAKLKNCPSSPRKMRLVADMIRGLKIEKALLILKYSKKQASEKLNKLLFSAISNWKNNNKVFEENQTNLFIKEIRVDEGFFLKRLKPAPQGRGHRIRKRSNHVTIVIDKISN